MLRALLLILTSACLCVSAQSSEGCPNVSIDGPASLAQPGQEVRFSARIAVEQPIGYKWSANTEIHSGQGTRSISIIQRPGTMTVTVEILGLRLNCPNTASETSSYDPPPEPIKVGSVQSFGDGAFESKITEFLDELVENSDNQGYVFWGYSDSTTQDISQERWQRFKTILQSRSNPFDPARITISGPNHSRDIVEFWRVPPGAKNPECAACQPVTSCPEISIVGPTELIPPGTPVNFAADIKGDLPPNARFVWTVSQGTIMAGFGTPSIVLEQVGVEPGSAIKTTLKIEGLPDVCKSEVSKSSNVGYTCRLSITLDEYGKIPVNEERGRLDNAAHEAAQYVDGVLLFIVRIGKNESRASANVRTARIRDHLKFRKTPPDRIRIAFGRSDARSTIIYLVPADAIDSIKLGYDASEDMATLYKRK